MARALMLVGATAWLAFGPHSQAIAAGETSQDQFDQRVHDYILAHPEVIMEALQSLDVRQREAEAKAASAVLTAKTDEVFRDSASPVGGNAQGNVTMAEFFDYNCGYCKRAMTDMLDLLKNDPKLKFVLKEFPVLGEGSVQAAQVAAAARIQDKGGKKYLEFHQKLLGGRGQADRARALAVAKDVGFDMAKLEKDMAGDEVKQQIEESLKLGEALGLNGTPSYVVGSDIVVGAVGIDALKGKINAARCGKETC